MSPLDGSYAHACAVCCVVLCGVLCAVWPVPVPMGDEPVACVLRLKSLGSDTACSSPASTGSLGPCSYGCAWGLRPSPQQDPSALGLRPSPQQDC